ncbi:hypothetical protein YASMINEVIRUS_427 [Yasminevirus sp. GU-2018]|uniref:Uncharacterized protein n=1 Tax=Yasminevirus sp. GU-2018 TaxID=2420051 RepID=A0A5K0U900_9VIRU|nr:hypothetical protein YASMINEVIRUS_427 [Yasminevirus sp. GU-2018]
MNDLYKYIDSWNDKRIFLYVTVFIFVLWFFSKKEIGMNILIALIVGSFIIAYLNNRSITTTDTLEEIQKIKKDNIKPELSDQVKEHDPVVNLLFSVQDMYAYNPQQYEEMVRYINQFYDKYQLSFVDPKMSHINYGLMKQYKRDALNAFMAMIFSLPDDKKARDKVNATTIVLDGILTKDLDQVSYLIDEDIYKSGYNVDTKIIDYGVKPCNEYDDLFNPFSYEVY